MRLTLNAAEIALALNGYSVTSAAAMLRDDGYKFSDQSLRQMAASIAESTDAAAMPVPAVGGELLSADKRRKWAAGKTLVFTCAQNNTKLHELFWQSLMVYIRQREAQLHVSRFLYMKDTKNAKVGSSKASDTDDVWYDPRIEPYVSDESLQITKDLVWCGELNIIPTRAHPLSTLKTYTKGASGIVPHVKLRMDSIPTMKHDPARFMYTTGTVTQRNYIQRVAGQVADFHHVFGALVVEVDDSGNWWARQLNADSTGGFYDLDSYYGPEGWEPGNRIAAITHGDIHIGKRDVAILNAVFDSGGILDKLHPHEQFFHDTLDFTARNHHNIKDPHFLWSVHASKQDSVQSEFTYAAHLMDHAYRSWCKTVVVLSNHDVAITHWLKNTTAFYDPVNVWFWLHLNQRLHENVQDSTYSPFIDAMQIAQAPVDTYVREDESYKIHGTSIEAGLHGHLGPSGARGSPMNLRVVGKANTGHTHSAGIVDGIYTSGVYGKLDMGYNKGLSSWSHSFTITYLNGKRAIATIKHGKAWR